jgi:SWIM zinc finger
VTIRPLAAARWSRLKASCSGRIGSAIELLQGRFSSGVMTRVTDPDSGLFPGPREMSFDCSCPDWADMCKHVAAVLYGVGTRLDAQPEILFRLRAVDPAELVGAASVRSLVGKRKANDNRILGEDQLSEVFGIDVAVSPAQFTTARLTRARPKVRPPQAESVRRGKDVVKNKLAGRDRNAPPSGAPVSPEMGGMPAFTPNAWQQLLSLPIESQTKLIQSLRELNAQRRGPTMKPDGASIQNGSTPS